MGIPLNSHWSGEFSSHHAAAGLLGGCLKSAAIGSVKLSYQRIGLGGVVEVGGVGYFEAYNDRREKQRPNHQYTDNRNQILEIKNVSDAGGWDDHQGVQPSH